MRIGIDASRAFVADRTGTEEYSYQIIRHILELPEAKEHEWILYTKFKIQTSKIWQSQRFASKANSKIKIINIPMPYLWTQVGLAVRTWTDNLDCLWVPAHTLPVLRKPGLKTVVTVHGIEYEWLPAYENALQRWYLPFSTKYVVLSAKKIIAVSEFTKRQLVERLGADGNKITVIYEGVGTQIQNANNKFTNQIQILKKYNIKPKQYLLYVGTIQPRKNLERLIEAFSVLNLKLVIAGKWGWTFDGVKQAPAKFGVEDRVVFTGYISEQEKEALLKNCLVYVQPSITEGFGLPVLEAFAAGVPVVSSNGGALAEIVGDAGELFDPMDTEAISHSLSLVIHSHSLQKELIKRGRERVKKFSWETAARQTFKSLLNL
jgi:glycosyltransferase involved in cell wall biosynthesis